MNDFRQNRFPFSGAVAPVPGAEPMLFNEQCNEGVGNWSLFPGFFASTAGAQNVPAGYIAWDPRAVISPGAFPSLIDVSRGAWINQPVAPAPASGLTYAWLGNVARTTPAWEPDADAFYLQVFTRVGMLLQPVENPIAAPAGYGGIIISLAELGGLTDGPFIALGIREGEEGLEASFSKWSDSATLVDTYDKPTPAGSVFLRAVLAVDPEDGVTVQYPEWSIDGFGWQLIGPELLLEEPGNTHLTLGFAGTSYNDGIEPRSNATVVDSLQVFGPYVDDAQSLYRMRLLTQGGRNWP